MADITRRIPDCDDDCGERGERGERGHRGHRGHDGKDAGPIVHDASLIGEGTESSPLAINVIHDWSLTGDGNAGGTTPLAINIQHDGTLAGNGTAGSPLSAKKAGIDLQDNGVDVPGNPHATLNFIGGGVEATDAGGGVANVTIPGDNFVFRPDPVGVQTGNVYTSWTDLMAAKALAQGFVTIQIDSSIVSPAVIPSGTYDMRQTEIFGFYKSGAVGLGIVNSLAIGDGVIFTDLRKIGGDLAILNNNTVQSPVTITLAANERAIFELGAGIMGDFPQIIQGAGAKAFWDCSTLVSTNTFLLRGGFQLSGATPAIEFGNSNGTLGLTLFEARIFSGMINGTNAAAKMPVQLGMSIMNRQNFWTGVITFGTPNSLYAAFGGNGATPPFRTQQFPAQADPNTSPVPSVAGLTFAQGAGMNTSLLLNAAGGTFDQFLPIIRTVTPATGSSNATAGVVNSYGMIVVVKETDNTNPVTVKPSGTDTIEKDRSGGPLASVSVPAGGSRIFQSDGVGNWTLIGGIG